MIDTETKFIVFMLSIIVINTLFLRRLPPDEPSRKAWRVLKIKMYLIGRFRDLRMKGQELSVTREYEIGEKLEKKEIRQISSFLDNLGYKVLGASQNEVSTVFSIREWK
jgi:hypothetical protein